MRITFVLPTINMSGGIRVVSIYASLLQERGHKVTLVCPARKKYPLWHKKVKAFLFGKGWTKNHAQHKSHLDNLGLDLRILGENRPVLDKDVPDADVVIASWWETAEWVNDLSSCKGKKVYFIQHFEVHEHLPFERSYATYRLPLHKIVIAKWLYNIMRSEFSDQNVDIVPNAVNHDQFYAPLRSKGKTPTVGFLYSRASFKGIDVTVKAIEVLQKKFLTLNILSFGSLSPEGGEFGSLSVDFHLSPEQNRIKDLYSQCDVWLTASKTEGFNLPAMEAMACRTPVVSTKAGWPEEAIIDGVNGYLVDVDDAEALASRAEQVLDLSKSEWEDMSKNAFNTVANSSWGASTKLFEDVLLSLTQS